MPIDKSSITQVKLKDGTMVGINEHVYLTPEHLGEPYYIGRIMEFCKVPNRKGLQVRVAWYNRPKDVFNLKSYDASLLIATMNSDLNHISSIRGKCKVVHKHYIPKDQFEHYKTQEDRFYYTQLYDRYMQRVYDLLPCDLVQNVPMDVQEALRQRYQFIVVEQGKAADLTGARRTCCVCQTWCNSASSVKCAGCQKNFHMTCLSPPLTRKPSKGFAWQCAFCSKTESDDSPVSSSSQSQVITRTTTTEPGKRTARLRSQQQLHQEQQKLVQKAKQQLVKKEKEKGPLESSRKHSLQSNLKIYEDPSQVRTTHMWPFRYFGVNTNIKDILDIDDRIYPRAASRIGSKYQAVVPDWKDSSDHETNSAMAAAAKKRPGRPASKQTSSQSSASDDAPYQEYSSVRSKRTMERPGKATKRKDTGSSQSMNGNDLPNVADELILARGTDNTVTAIFSEPDRLKGNHLDDYIRKVQALPNLPMLPHSADVYDLALLMLQESNYDTRTALDKIRRVTKEDFAFLVTWQPDEIKAFEQSIQDNGHELFFVKNRIPTKSMADIVRFFYQWKKSDRYEPVYSVWTKVFKPAKKFKKNTRSILDCLGKHQRNDRSIITAFSLQQQQQTQPQQQGKFSANSINGVKQKQKQLGSGRKKKGPSAATVAAKHDNTTELSDTSDESDSDEKDDPTDKSYPKPWKRRLDDLDTASAPTTRTQARPGRITRQSTSLAKFASTTKETGASGKTTTSKDRKLDDGDDSNGDDDDGTMEMTDDPTVIPSDAISNNDPPIECHNCHATQSTIWRRVPGDTDRKQKTFDRALCDDCGTHWLKYSKKRPVHAQVPETNGALAVIKSRGRAMKRKPSQLDDDLVGATLKKVKDDPTLIKTPLLPCQVCNTTELPKRLVYCVDCGLVVHYDCFGVDENSIRSWRCDVCKNKKKPTVSNLYQCTLCGNEPSEKQHPLKATSGYNWSHVTCALFSPQVKFIDPSTMSPIEYVGATANTNHKEKCKLCARTGVGSYISCHDEKCTVRFHAQCALEHGYQAGFTIESPSTANDGTPNEPVVTIRLFDRSSPSGVMIPRIYCPHHDLSSSMHFYPMNTRSLMHKSWIKIYSDLYKPVDPNTTPAMRRYFSWCQRNKLPLPDYYNHTQPSVHNMRTNNNVTLTSKSENTYQSALSNPSCSQCPVTSSPFWWTLDDLESTIGTENVEFTGKICQRCYCKYQRQGQQTGVISGV